MFGSVSVRFFPGLTLDDRIRQVGEFLEIKESNS